MTLPPEKISELKQIIHSQLSQVNIEWIVDVVIKTCWCMLSVSWLSRNVKTR